MERAARVSPKAKRRGDASLAPGRGQILLPSAASWTAPGDRFSFEPAMSEKTTTGELGRATDETPALIATMRALETQIEALERLAESIQKQIELLERVRSG